MRPPLAAPVVVVLLVASGCLGFGGPDRPPSDDRAEATVADARAAVTDVTAYRTRIDGQVVAQDGDDRLSASFDGNIRVNASQRRLNATVRASDGGQGAGLSSGTRRAYVDNYTAYSECRVGWERRNLSEGRPWIDYTPAGQQLLLLNNTDVYWRGTETVDGTEAALVVAYPTEEELQVTSEVTGTEQTDFEDASLENATVRLWVDTSTDRPVRAQREIELSDGGATATATVTFRFRGYDEPTTADTLRVTDDTVVRELGC